MCNVAVVNFVMGIQILQRKTQYYELTFLLCCIVPMMDLRMGLSNCIPVTDQA